MEAMFANPADNGRKGKPAVEKKIPRPDTIFFGLAQEIKHHLGGLFDAFHPSFVASGTLIDPWVNPTEAVMFLFGTEQGKGHRQKSVTVRPAQGEHPKSPDILVFTMIPHPRQQFNSFAPIAAVERIIEDKDILPATGGQRHNGFLDYS